MRRRAGGVSETTVDPTIRRMRPSGHVAPVLEGVHEAGHVASAHLQASRERLLGHRPAVLQFPEHAHARRCERGALERAGDVVLEEFADLEQAVEDGWDGFGSIS